ncbi:alpha-hydroxy acid oxidase [Streptomyces sp. NPDC057271]|uniref:alpha-hydroxy acid oxidase n=1 Tax=unclassified Streptomyces TaxID=2593676 RepID=UPI00363C3DA3
MADIETEAAKRLPDDIKGFVASGAGRELTLQANRSALDHARLIPRVLVDVGDVTTACTLLGAPAALPVAVAPMAYHRALHPDGELATAAAARRTGAPFTVSTLSSQTVEDIAATGGTLWFQLYWLKDRGLVAELLRRAEAAGCRALMLTVDVPRMGRRIADMRSGFAVPPWVRPVHLHGRDVEPGPVPSQSHRRAGASAVAEHTRAVFDPSLSWKDVAWLREQTELPLVLKGILHPDDAATAVDLGVDALVVSNHGGRQLEGAIAAIDALPDIADVVAGRAELLLDGGVCCGTDILKALALGASGVMVGRPVLWGLATAGAAGVARVLHLLKEELETEMAIAGCPNVAAARRLVVQSQRRDTGH